MNSRDKQNEHYNKWLPQARKHFLNSRNQKRSIKISHKFHLFVLSWWFHVIVAIILELNLMAYA